MKAAEILAHHDEPKLWSGLLNSRSEDVRFRTLSYLTDRRDGKPKQQVDVSGGLMHAHTVYRDPRLANLSADELASLDSLTRKLVTTAQDGPHNQIESNTAARIAGRPAIASNSQRKVQANLRQEALQGNKPKRYWRKGLERMSCL
jgi:hypothetical protein